MGHSSGPEPRSGGHILAQGLKRHGVDHVFCVPGESYLDLLDGFYDVADQVRLVTCRHEGGAANMADAYAKLTGRPGVCLVTRAPGACHASVGVFTASQDSTPFVLLIGQVRRDEVDRETFQEINYRRMFAHMAKWVSEIRDPARIPELLAHALHLATSGRQGPVVLALPVDMLAESARVLDAEPYRSVRPHPGARELERMRALLAAAERPLMLVGGSGWTDQARADIVAFAGANDLPTVSSFRRQDIFDNHHPNYIGHLSSRVDPALVETFKRADLVLVVGSRFGERTSLRYTLMEVPRPEKTFIHVHADADEIGRVYQPALGIASGVSEFASAARALAPLDGSRWARWAEEGRAAYEASLVPRPLGGDLDLGEVMAALAERLPEDAIITSDAGTSVSWPYQYIALGARQRHLGPTSGSMGYAVPAAVAAAIVNPERMAVALVGDGGFLMTGNELATAVHYRVAPLVVLFNNGMYGSVRANQERRFPGRVVATGLTNPGFADMARSFRAHGEVVTHTHEFGPAFERAVASGKPGVIELMCDPEQLDPFTTLSGVRARALAAAT